MPCVSKEPMPCVSKEPMPTTLIHHRPIHNWRQYCHHSSWYCQSSWKWHMWFCNNTFCQLYHKAMDDQKIRESWNNNTWHANQKCHKNKKNNKIILRPWTLNVKLRIKSTICSKSYKGNQNKCKTWNIKHNFTWFSSMCSTFWSLIQTPCKFCFMLDSPCLISSTK